jgi:hypothetical protein
MTAECGAFARILVVTLLPMFVHDIDLPEALIEAHRAGNLVIFVGAGASRDAHRKQTPPRAASVQNGTMSCGQTCCRGGTMSCGLSSSLREIRTAGGNRTDQEAVRPPDRGSRQ